MNKKIEIGIIILIILIIIGIILFLYNKKKNNKKIIVSCIGDSITEGFGVKNNRNAAWPNLLNQKLKKEVEVKNFGVVRATLLSTGDLPYNSTDKAKSFWNQEEDIVLLMLGTNDSKPMNWNKELFEKEYQDMIEKIQQKNKKTKLYLLIPPRIYENTNEKDRPNNKILKEEIIPIIEKLAKENNLPVIDLYKVCDNHEEWFDDQLHPNKEGNLQIVKEIARILNQNMI